MIMSADFETLATDDIQNKVKNKEMAETYVWAWGVMDVDNFEYFRYGNSIQSFFDFICKDAESHIIFFHNLDFDISFIFDYLFRNGYKYSKSRKAKTFQATISDMNTVYSVDVVVREVNGEKKMLTFRDSLKKIPMKVKNVAIAFELPILKGEIDYKEYRSRNHKITEKELAYLKNDVEIIARALRTTFDEGMTKITIASDSMGYYKDLIGKDLFKNFFPPLSIEVDDFIRNSYKGGWVYNKFKNMEVKNGISYDNNSMYPYVMRDKYLPVELPIKFVGQYKHDNDYPLYIIHFIAEFKVKDKHLPTIQLKSSVIYGDTYITETDGATELWLTSVDFELFLDHYDVFSINYIDGYKFKQIKGLFTDYINHFGEIKEKSTGGKRVLAKLRMNSLYGKFAMNPIVKSKRPILDREKNRVRYIMNDDEEREPMYTALASFVTSYARDLIIRTAQVNYDRFIYSDTDSIYMSGVEEPTNINIHPTELGAWKLEHRFQKGRFIRPKTYIIVEDGKNIITCSGMNDDIKSKTTYDDFKQGYTTSGSLKAKKIKGGTLLVDSSFSIKYNK